jgi:hypothetical protein
VILQAYFTPSTLLSSGYTSTTTEFVLLFRPIFNQSTATPYSAYLVEFKRAATQFAVDETQNINTIFLLQMQGLLELSTLQYVYLNSLIFMT